MNLHTHNLGSSPDFWVSLYACHGYTPRGVSILRIPLVGIAIPTSLGNDFLSQVVSVDILFCHLSSLKTDNSTQPQPTENSGEFDLLQPLVA